MDSGARAAARLCRAAGQEVADARADLLAAGAAEWAGPAAREFADAVAGLLAGLARVAGELDRAHDAARHAAVAAAAPEAAEGSAC